MCALKKEVKKLKCEKQNALRNIEILEQELVQCTDDLLQLQDILVCIYLCFDFIIRTALISRQVVGLFIKFLGNECTTRMCQQTPGRTAQRTTKNLRNVPVSIRHLPAATSPRKTNQQNPYKPNRRTKASNMC